MINKIKQFNDEQMLLKFLRNETLTSIDPSSWMDIIEVLSTKEYFLAIIFIISNFNSLYEVDYYKTTYLLIDAYLKTNQIDQAKDLLAEELKMPYIPKEYDERFNDLKKELASKTIETIKKALTKEEIEEILEKPHNKVMLIRLIIDIANHNIRLFLPSIKVFFKRDDVPNLFKVLLVSTLKQQDIDEYFPIIKNNKEHLVNPIHFKDIVEEDTFQMIESIVEREYNLKQPGLVKTAKETIFLYFVYEWPRIVEKTEIDYLLTALNLFLYEMFGIDDEVEISPTLEKNKIDYYKACLKEASSV